MALFAASLSTLKKRASNLASEVLNEVKAIDPRRRAGLEEVGAPSRETKAAFRTLVQGGPQGASPADSIVVVRYEVQNGDDGEREMAAFPLVTSESTITAQHVRRQFPVPGRFHFRFKAPSLDGSFGDFLWMDLCNDAETVPMWRGDICMKALRLPDNADAAREFESVPNSTLSAMAEATSAVPMPAYSPPPASSPALGSPGGSSPLGTPRWQGFDEAPSPASFEPEERVSSSAPSPSARPAEQAPPRPQPPPSDLIEMDFGGPAAKSPAPGRPAAAASAASPPAAPVQYDREELVKRRVEAEKKRVEDHVRKMQEQQQAEEQLKADKVAEGARIDAEMTKWAKTPDGQAYKDIKVLLSTLHTVTWPGCTWQELPLSQLLSGGSVKKHYFKAILLFHPDKQKEAGADQQVRADRIFQALNEAYKKDQ